MNTRHPHKPGITPPAPPSGDGPYDGSHHAPEAPEPSAPHTPGRTPRRSPGPSSGGEYTASPNTAEPAARPGRPDGDPGRNAAPDGPEARASGTGPPLRRPAVFLVGPALGAWLAALVVLVLPERAGWGVALVCAGVGVAGLVVARRRASGGDPPGPGTATSAANAAGDGRAAARIVAAVALCATAGAVSAALRVSAVRDGPVPELAARHRSVEAELVVTDSVQRLPSCPGTACRTRTLTTARLETVYDGSARRRATAVRVPVLVLAGADALKMGLGQRFRVEGRLEPPHDGELLAAVVLVRGRVHLLGRPPPLDAFAQTVRLNLRRAVSELPQPERGLLPALVVGDRTGISPETADRFKAAGMTHLLAVSGANLAIIAAVVTGVARLLRRPVVAALAVLPATVLFVLVCGPEPSVLRAAVMGLIAAMALAAGHERPGLHALAVAVLGLVLFDPELARSYGFALSALATGGILLLARPIGNRLAHRVPHRLALALAVPTAAELVCAPVIAMMSSQVSLVAVPANLVADPLVAPATVLGVLVAVTAPVAPSVAGVLAWPAGCAVAGISAVASVSATVPHAVIAWPGGPAGAVTLLAAIVAGYLLVRRLRRRYRALVIAAALTVLVVSVTFRVAAPGWPARRWLLTACDVGQGDGLALYAGAGRAVVVDTGPRPDLMDACLHRLGVTQIPLIVLTHFHADHAGGISGVLNGRSVGAVLVSPYHVPEEQFARVSRALAARHIPLWTSVPGWRTRIGPVDLTVLGPAPETASAAATEDEDAGPNDASVVLYARDGPLTVLLTGDVEPPAQEALLAAGVPHAAVLKVPHHGSSNQDPEFLAAPGASTAIISVGKDNGYGHPAPRTLDRLRGLGQTVYRTDLDGDVEIAGDGRGGLVASTHTAPP